MKFFTFPSAVTLGKLLLSPLLLPFFLVYLLPFHNFIINIVLVLLFISLRFADVLERYFEGRYQFVSVFGKQLDPIADTLVSFATLVALLAAGKIFFYWVIILVGCDLFVMGLRLVAHDHNVTISGSFVEKIRILVQPLFLAFVILNPYQSLGLCSSWNVVELFLLFTTLGLNVFSAKLFFDQFNKHISVSVPLDFQDHPSATVQEPEDESHSQKPD